MEKMVNFISVQIKASEREVVVAPPAPPPEQGDVQEPPAPRMLKRTESVNGDGTGLDYSGASFAIRFYVDKPIHLFGLGFAGIHEKSPGNRFMMSVEVTGEYNDGGYPEDYFYPRTFTEQPVVIPKGKGFTVGMGRVLRIPSHTFIVVRMWIFPQDRNHRGEVQPVKLKTLKGVKPGSVDHNDGVSFALGNSISAFDELYFTLCGCPHA